MKHFKDFFRPVEQSCCSWIDYFLFVCNWCFLLSSEKGEKCTVTEHQSLEWVRGKRCTGAHSWGGTSSWWCGHMTQRFSITVYHMSLLPGLIAPTGTLQKSVGQICCICVLRVLSPCERNTQKFVVPGAFPYRVIVENRLLGWPPSFWTLCQPITVHPCWCPVHQSL